MLSSKEILSSQKFIDKGKDYDMLMPWLGEGLLTSAGNIFPIFSLAKFIISIISQVTSGGREDVC